MDPEIWEEVKLNQQEEGTVLICEQLRFEYRRGFPRESLFFRVTVRKKGLWTYAQNEPDFEWPGIPPWLDGWTYDGSMFRWWRKR